MSDEKFEGELRAANPVGKPTLDDLDLAGGEGALGEAIVAETSLAGDLTGAAPPHPRRRRSLPLIAGASAAAAAVIVALLVGGGTSPSPETAYGAQLVRFAESTPLLLLEGPDWRVQNVTEAARGRYMPPSRSEGTMEFVTGKPVPYESLNVELVGKPKRLPDSRLTYQDQRVTGMLPAAVRQRKVELRWFQGNLAESISLAREIPHPHGQSWTRLPVLDTTAAVDTRAEFYVNQGGPGDRRMIALWSEDGYVLEMKAWVPDLAAFQERLGWLTRVDSAAWLDAMPDEVVKAADHDVAVREMLKGIPVPAGFKPSLIPDEGLTTNRAQVASSVAGIVSCQWFLQWGEARRTGDHAAEAEAERAMATSRHWPILRAIAKENGGYPPTEWQLAEDMPSGRGKRGWRLLPQAEALGCARWGMPLLPRKQRRQAQRATISG